MSQDYSLLKFIQFVPINQANHVNFNETLSGMMEQQATLTTTGHNLIPDSELFSGLLGILTEMTESGQVQMMPLAAADETIRLVESDVRQDRLVLGSPVKRFSFFQLPVTKHGEIQHSTPDSTPPSRITQQLALTHPIPVKQEHSGPLPVSSAPELLDQTRMLVTSIEPYNSGAERALKIIRSMHGVEAVESILFPARGDYRPIQPAPAVSTGLIPLRPAHADWPIALANRVMWLVEGGRERIDLRLDPPQLGQLSVRLRLDGDQASVSFQSQHAFVRDIVETSLPRLRELMAQAGYTLSDVDVSHGGNSESETGRSALASRSGSGDEVEEVTDDQLAEGDSGHMIDAYI